jgi:tol-pal system protein YbgF
MVNYRSSAFIVFALALLVGCGANRPASEHEVLQSELDRARMRNMKDSLLEAQLQLDQAREQMETLRREKEVLAKAVISCREENDTLNSRMADLEKPQSIQGDGGDERELEPSKVDAPPRSAEELYQQALLFYESKQYESALQSLKDLLFHYPSHDLSDNAQFWIGVCYLNLDQLGAAHRAFNEVLERYPAGNKVPDAMLMIGTLEQRRGAVEQYRQMLAEIIRRYPQSEAAGRARKKLALQGSGLNR